MAKVLRFLLALAIVMTASVAFAFPASAVVHTCDGSRPCDIGNQIVISGQVVVTDSQSAKNVIIFNGDVQVDGRVRKTVFVLNGDVIVTGRVTNDVIALNGKVRVADGAFIGGDVSSREKAIISSGAVVKGSVDRVEGRFALGELAWVGRIVLWIALTVSVFVLGAALILIAPRALEAATRAGRTAIWPSIGLGFAVAIGLPTLAVLLLFSIVGLPLGVGLLLALGLFYAIGYTVGAFFLGRLILPGKNPWLAMLVGLAIVRVVDLVPVLGTLVGFAAMIYGVGMMTVAVFRARRPDPTAVTSVSVS